MNLSTRHIAGGILRDFRFTWRHLAVTDLLTRIAGVAILAPILALLLRLLLTPWGRSAVTDEELMFFFLRPLGLVILLLVGGGMAAIALAEYACLLSIGFSASGHRRVPWLQAFRFVGGRLPAIFCLGVLLLVRVTVIAAPFLVASALTYLALLTRYDINYYLSEKPPAFVAAAFLAGALGVTFSIILLRKLLAWIFALPILLFQRKRPSASIRDSAAATNGHRWTILGWLVAWVLVSATTSSLVTVIIGYVGRTLIPTSSGSLALVSLGVGSTLLITAVANAVVSFVMGALLVLLIVRLYGEFVPQEEVETPSLTAEVRPSRPRLSLRLVPLTAGVSVVVLLLLAVVLARSVKGEDQVAVTAHRGASGSAPENTLAAVEGAITAGSDWVEIDVQETADGVVVVAHDRDLMKTAGVALRIGTATYDELRQIDVGSWYAREFAGQRLPTLDEVLAQCQGRAGVTIELKHYGHEERLEERVIEIVEARGMQNDIAVMSLKQESIRKIKQLRPHWKVGQLAAVAVGNLTKLPVDFVAVSVPLATSSLIRSAHRRDMDVHVWTVNDPLQMSDLISRGVDNLITDEPALARSVIAERATMSPAERLLVRVGRLAGLVGATEPEPDESDA